MPATRLDTWVCPLCGRRTARSDALRHGGVAHPATLPRRMTVPDRLRLIPALAREVMLTVGAPNPDAQADQTRRPTHAHPPLPIDAGALDVLAADDGREEFSRVPITRLAECSRIVWEALDPDLRPPQPLGEPTFAAECGWLARAWPDAVLVLDLADVDWIDSETRVICSQLAAVARMSREARYECPDCGNPMHLGESGWMVCESGAHMHPGPDRLTSQWRHKPPMTTNHLAAELRILSSRIRKWHERGKIAPIDPDRKPLFWYPWDVVRCLYPDVVAAIESADDARAS